MQNLTHLKMNYLSNLSSNRNYGNGYKLSQMKYKEKNIENKISITSVVL